MISIKKVLIINTMGLYNYGGRAVIKGFIKSLQKNIPNIQIFFMLTHYKSEYQIYEKWNYKNVKLIDHIWYKDTNSNIINVLLSGVFAPFAFLRFLSYRYLHKVLPIKSPYHQYDLIIDLTTDGPNDHYGMLMPFFFMYNTFLATISGKRVIICAASIGKFNKPITKLLAKFVLNRVELITVREEISKNYLKDFGINQPRIKLTADHAFLMDPVPIERIDEIFTIEDINKDNGPIIGISPSQLIHKYAFQNINDIEIKYNKYIDVMVRITDFLIEELECMIILIPHSSPASSIISNEDDFTISKNIYKEVINKKNLRLISGKYDTDELKGVIGQCDMFIGCRMHSTIASTSMMVPTIAIVYGHKSHGIIGKMMGQEKCIIKIENCTPEQFLLDMKSRINYVWNNRYLIRDELKVKSRIAQKKALLNGKLTKEILDSYDAKK